MSDAAEDAGRPTCAACGDPVEDDATHRVRTWVEDGSVEYRHFCDDDCLGRWDG